MEQRKNSVEARENAPDARPTENAIENQQRNENTGPNDRGSEEEEKREQIEKILNAFVHTDFKELNEPVWKALSGGVGLIKGYIKELQAIADNSPSETSSSIE